MSLFIKNVFILTPEPNQLKYSYLQYENIYNPIFT